MGLSVIAVFAFFFLYEWFFHGHFMNSMYMETANLWRPEEEMKSKIMWIWIGQLAISFMFNWIFTKGYEGKGILEGVRYGILMSLFMSAPSFVMYAIVPYPVMMLVYWAIGGLIEFSIAGAIAALIYKPKTA